MNYGIVYDNHGTGVVAPLPTSTELQEFYSKKYYQKPVGQYSEAYSSEEISFFNFFNELIYVIAKEYSPRIPSTFADIGCGEGYASAYFHAKDLEVFAADFSDYGIRLHNPETLNQISFKQCDIVSDDSIYQGKKDLILVKNVLEHVIDAEKLVANLKKMMHSNSLLAIQVPNDTSNPILDTYRSVHNIEFVNSKPFSPPEHLRYFSHASLESFLNSMGLKKVVQLGDFPIEMLLLNSHTDYYSTPVFGKHAHSIRVSMCNILKEVDALKVIDLCKSLGNLSMGRDIIGIYKLRDLQYLT